MLQRPQPQARQVPSPRLEKKAALQQMMPSHRRMRTNPPGLRPPVFPLRASTQQEDLTQQEVLQQLELPLASCLESVAQQGRAQGQMMEPAPRPETGQLVQLQREEAPALTRTRAWVRERLRTSLPPEEQEPQQQVRSGGETAATDPDHPMK